MLSRWAMAWRIFRSMLRTVDQETPRCWLPAGRRCRLYPGSHEVNGPEPFDQEYLGGMKQSSGTYGDLMSAACVLVEPARGNERCFGVAACRTLKTLWPSHFDQNSTAGLLRSKSFLPLYQTECWHSHSKTLYLKYQSDLSCKYTCIREKRSIKITDNTVNI